MVQYKYYCGVSGGRDLVYKDMEGVCAEECCFRWIYTMSYFICDVIVYVVFLL